jgi:hypothetical protein
MSALAHAVSLIKRWAAVTGDGQCWPYKNRTFANSRNGSCVYGLVYVHGKKVRAHRRAYELAYGEIPASISVCHTCDNPLCCNPAHLFLGTSADNNADKMQKGRHFSYSGERNPLAKLTDAQAEEVARRARSGESQRALAAEFGVSQPAVSRLKKLSGYQPQMVHV